VTARELALRREILVAFAETGAPPAVIDGREALRSLADQHVVVLDDQDHVLAAHPFATPPGGARVASGGRTWSGNCAWDALGIVAALGLHEADVTAGGVTVRVRDGRLIDDAWFQVGVPARHWWDDIAYT